MRVRTESTETDRAVRRVLAARAPDLIDGPSHSEMHESGRRHRVSVPSAGAGRMLSCTTILLAACAEVGMPLPPAGPVVLLPVVLMNSETTLAVTSRNGRPKCRAMYSLVSGLSKAMCRNYWGEGLHGGARAREIAGQLYRHGGGPQRSGNSTCCSSGWMARARAPCSNESRAPTVEAHHPPRISWTLCCARYEIKPCFADRAGRATLPLVRL